MGCHSWLTDAAIVLPYSTTGMLQRCKYILLVLVILSSLLLALCTLIILQFSINSHNSEIDILNYISCYYTLQSSTK